MFPKKKRIVDKESVNYVKALPCVICGISPSDAHHITSRGASGDDTLDNLIPLARKYHIELHTIGIRSMSKKYPEVRRWLVRHQRKDVLEMIKREDRAENEDNGFLH